MLIMSNLTKTECESYLLSGLLLKEWTCGRIDNYKKYYSIRGKNIHHKTATSLKKSLTFMGEPIKSL